MQNDAFDIYTTKSLPFRILPPKFRHRMYIPDAYRHIATLIPSRLLVYKVPLALDTSIVGKKTAAKPAKKAQPVKEDKKTVQAKKPTNKKKK